MKYIFSLFLFFIFCNDMYAQVPVREEPHHKPVLENDYVRLLDVHINPGDTTFYHIHAAPSVIVFISKSTIGSQKLGETPSTPNEVLPGQTSYVDYGTNPITHRVYNAGKNVFHVMDIELVMKAPSPDSCPALQQSNVTTAINEKLVRVYRCTLNASQSINITKSSCAHLLVCIAGEINTLNKNLTTGDYMFFNTDTKISVENKGSNNSVYVVLELK